MIKFRMMMLTRKKKTDTDTDDTEEIIVKREKETGQPL
jgi:hypothetical protein